MSLLIAPVRIFVDEAGTPHFAPSANAQPRPYIPCAVAIPTACDQAIARLLPRGRDGQLLKASDVEFTEQRAVEFLEELLRREVDVSLVLTNASGNESVEVARNATEAANKHRTFGRRKVRQPNLLYALLMKDAVIAAWGAASRRHGDFLTFVDLYLDEANLGPDFGGGLVEKFRRNTERKGLRLGAIEWRAESEEPLLLVPDIIAGVFHRRVMTGECEEACRLLLDAGKAGRIRIQDGATFTTAGPPAPA